MTENFIIPLNGLKSGKSSFSWQVGTEFFRQYENSEILIAELEVEAVVEKAGTYLGIDAKMTGRITVACDRCGDDVSLPMNVQIPLSVKFGEPPVDEEEVAPEDGREIVYESKDSQGFDMSQIIYDYACVSLPMRRVHPEGECNPEALKYLMNEGCGELEDNTEPDSPFAALKDLLDGKK